MSGEDEDTFSKIVALGQSWPSPADRAAFQRKLKAKINIK